MSSRTSTRRRVVSALIATLGCLAVLGPAVAVACRSQATIVGSFGDSCRAFTARSSKDISHVVIR